MIQRVRAFQVGILSKRPSTLDRLMDHETLLLGLTVQSTVKAEAETFEVALGPIEVRSVSAVMETSVAQLELQVTSPLAAQVSKDKAYHTITTVCPPEEPIFRLVVLSIEIHKGTCKICMAMLCLKFAIHQKKLRLEIE